MKETKLTVTATMHDTLAPRFGTATRGRLSKATEIEIGPVRTGAIHNQAEARTTAARQLQHWLDNWFKPYVVTFKTVTGIITAIPSQDPDQMGVHSLVAGVSSMGQQMRCDSSGSAVSLMDAKRELHYRMADAWVYWHNDDQVAEAARWLTRYEPTGEDARRLARYAGFQRAYRAAEANGEHDPHRWASDHEDAFTPSV